jgi:hypothetical protein
LTAPYADFGGPVEEDLVNPENPGCGLFGLVLVAIAVIVLVAIFL